MVLPKPLSSGWSGIKGSVAGTHWGTHTHTCTNTAKSLYPRRHRDGVWVKLPNVGRSPHTRTLQRVCGWGEWTLFESTFSSGMGFWLLYFPKIWWCHFPFLYILIPLFKCILANWFQWTHTGFVSIMINWCNVDTSQKSTVTLRSDTGNTCISSVCGRLVCIPGTVSMRCRGNPLPASSAWATYRQHMKYGSYLTEEKMSWDFIFCVCETCNGWARGRDRFLMGLWWNEKPLQRSFVHVTWTHLHALSAWLLYLVYVSRWKKIDM